MDRIQVWIVKRKTGCRKQCPDCETRNGATVKECRKCGASLRRVKRTYAGRGFSYSIRWQDPRTGTFRSQATGPDKSYAQHCAAQKRQELASGKISGRTAIGFDDFVLEHLEALEDTLSPGSCVEHERTLAQFKAACSPKDLTVIDFQMLEKFRAARIADGVSPATVNKCLRTLQSALERAVQRGYLTGNPFKEPGVRKSLFLREPEPVPTVLEPAEFAEVLKACPNDDWRAVCIIGYYAGLRIGEILSLEWTDLDLDRRMLHVRNKADHRTKSGKNRTVPLAREIEAALQTRMSSRFRGPFIFEQLRGRNAVANASRDFRKIVKRAGLVDEAGKPRFSLHDLRRTFCTNLLGTGTDPKTVQTLAGHADVGTTLKHYAAVRAQGMAEAIDRLSQLGMIGTQTA